MTPARSCGLVLLVVVLLGCPSGNDGPTTIRVDAYSRDCTRDDECIILESIVDCSSCCGDVAVRRGGVEAEHAAVVATCSARSFDRCTADCGGLRPACFEQTCVKVPVER